MHFLSPSLSSFLILCFRVLLDVEGEGVPFKKGAPSPSLLLPHYVGVGGPQGASLAAVVEVY